MLLRHWKLLLCVVASVVFVVPAMGQERLRWIVSCGGVFDLCGFIDLNTQQLVIERKFEQASLFSEGLARVRVKGRWGFIDEAGIEVIAPQFDLAGDFKFGLAEILAGRRTGAIDRTGKVVVAPRFTRSVPLTSEVLLVTGDGEWRSNSSFASHERLETLGGFPTIMFLPGRSLYHIRRGNVPMPKANLKHFDDSGRGLIWAEVAVDQRRKLIGLLRADGTWQLQPQFKHVTGGSRGSPSIVTVEVGGVEQTGIVDADGRLQSPFGEHKIRGWSGDFGIVSAGGGFGLIRRDGVLVGGRVYEKVQAEHSVGFPRVQVDGRWIAVRPNGTLIPEDAIVKIEATCPSGVKVAAKANGITIIGPDGRETLTYLLEDVHRRPFACDRPSPVLVGTAGEGGRWGFVDPASGQLVNGLPFEKVSAYRDGHAIVVSGGKWGIVDTTGAFTVLPSYDAIVPWGETGGTNGFGMIMLPVEAKHPGIYRAVSGKGETATTKAIDAKGGSVAPPPPPNARDQALLCGGNARIFRENGLWGLKAADGHVIIRAEYRALHCYSSGVAWAPIDREGKWCPVDPDGTVRASPPCVPSRYPFMMNSYPERFSSDDYESSVLWTAANLEFGIGDRQTPPNALFAPRW